MAHPSISSILKFAKKKKKALIHNVSGIKNLLGTESSCEVEPALIKFWHFADSVHLKC